MPDHRAQIVASALKAVNDHTKFVYSEGPNRMAYLGKPRGTYPVTTDCSGFVRWLWWMNNAPDPMGLGYKVPEGFTGTLLEHNAKVTKVIVGDIVVYGPGEGEHTAVVVEVHGGDILTVSHGDSVGPRLCWVNPPQTVPSRGYPSDGRQPQTFLQPRTATTPPPPPPKPKPKPVPPPPKPVPPPKTAPKPVPPIDRTRRV